MNKLWSIILVPLWFHLTWNSDISNLQISGYTSYNRFKEAIDSELKNKTLEAIDFVLKYSQSEPTGLLSQTNPDVIIFFQLFYSIVKDKQILTNLLLEITHLFENDKKKKTGISYRNWLETNFDFVADDIYYFVQTIAHGKTKGINEVPKVLSDQIILLENKYYLFERACTTGDEETVKWFLESNFQLRELDIKVLFHVFFKGYLNIIKLLLEYNYLREANVPVSDLKGKYLDDLTFLHVAAATGLNDTITYLIDNGVNINAKDISGRTPIYKAVEFNQIYAIAILSTKGADLKVVYGENGDSLLHVAVLYRHVESVKALLDLDFSINIKNSKGQEPIHIAAKQYDRDVISYLHKSKADINAKDNLGNTPLHIASFAGNITCVKLLLSLGANLDVQNELGQNPLHKSVEGGHVDIIEELFRHNPSLMKAAMSIGDTVTHLASDSGNKRVIETLLRLGAPPSLKNNKEQVPLFRAALKGNNEVVTLLKNYTDVNSSSLGLTMLHQAALEGNAYAVKLLIGAGINPDVQALWGNSALHVASGLGFSSVVKVLLDNRANPNIKNKSLMTPLHKAAIGGHLEVAKLLVQARIDNRAVDSFGKTALEYSMTNNHANLTEFLRANYEFG